MLGSNPSAVPGAETEGPGHRLGVPPDSRTLRDQHQSDKPTVQPLDAVAYRSTRAVTFTPNQHTTNHTDDTEEQEWDIEGRPAEGRLERCE
jgi:hypothetical protein